MLHVEDDTHVERAPVSPFSRGNGPECFATPQRVLGSGGRQGWVRDVQGTGRGSLVHNTSVCRGRCGNDVHGRD